MKYAHWWLVTRPGDGDRVVAEVRPPEAVREYLGHGWGAVVDGEWQFVTDRVCFCGHWIEEHTPDCESPGCECLAFADDPVQNTPEALAWRR